MRDIVVLGPFSAYLVRRLVGTTTAPLASVPPAKYAPVRTTRRAHLSDRKETDERDSRALAAVARIYELAVEQDPATRDAFLAETCAGDEALRHEVESLLRQDDASVVLDQPVWATAAPSVR